jgi:hypothetical protein
MRITWNTEVNAPCCPGEILADDGRTLLIQTDWDFPGVASSFGWNIADVTVYSGRFRLPCDHSETDGTVDCPRCGTRAGVFIEAARDWLTENDGATADDPGYFEM